MLYKHPCTRPFIRSLPAPITHLDAHTHAHAGLPPPHINIPLPIPRFTHPQWYPGRRPPTPKEPPTEGVPGGARQLGWHPQKLGPSLHVNGFINYFHCSHHSFGTAALAGSPCSTRLFRSRRRGTCLLFPVGLGIGVTGLPFCPVPQGPSRAAHHVLSVVAALAIPGSGPPPVASLCSSRREQPGARRGRGCGPRAKHRSGWRAGRREGSPPGGDRAGRRSALLRKERGSTGRKINVSQNICKIGICKLKQF